MLDGLAIAQKVIHSHGKQQVLVKAKGYIYVCEQLLGLWLDLLLVKQLPDLLLGYQLLVFMYAASWHAHSMYVQRGKHSFHSKTQDK